MHAWLCETLDGADALRWQDLPTPEPKPGEVRIAIKASSLNFPDMLIVPGQVPVQAHPCPSCPAAEYAGTVDAVGEGVKHLRVRHAGGRHRRHRRLWHPRLRAAEPLLPLPPGIELRRRRRLPSPTAPRTTRCSTAAS
jgi:NADPH2:quinone reductase